MKTIWFAMEPEKGITQKIGDNTHCSNNWDPRRTPKTVHKTRNQNIANASFYYTSFGLVCNFITLTIQMG